MSKMSKDAKTFYIKSRKENIKAGMVGRKPEASRLNSHDFDFDVQGKFRYFETVLGSGKFYGTEGLWEEGVPFWAMNYTGRTTALEFCQKFLNEALSKIDEDMPIRGIDGYEKDGYKYSCQFEGDLKWFSGREAVHFDGKLVYECSFSGGDVED
ncbi:MAG: DUF5680 domain-containing protein [Defluviitaleaceae bacterium]|nr:DUF5680 domain-containing protein [Defluviitaleaceae bacterium]